MQKSFGLLFCVVMLFAAVSYGCDDAASNSSANNTASPRCPELVWEGDFEGASTTELEGVTRIQGNVMLSQGANSTLIGGLACLEEVTGSLSIFGDASLVNLDELSSLLIVGGDLSISENSALQNVDGLSSLMVVGGYLIISNNEVLQSVNDLSLLTSVGGMVISDNRTLTTVEGLSSLTTVGERLEISSNDALQSVNDLSLLTSVGGMVISNNRTLTTVEGLSSLTTVGERLEISSNDALQNVDGFSSIKDVKGNLNVSNNRALHNVDGFSSLASLGGSLSISRNSVLCRAKVIGLIDLLRLRFGLAADVDDVSDNSESCVSNCGTPLVFEGFATRVGVTSFGNAANFGTCHENTAPEDVWRFTPSTSGTVCITTEGSSFDTTLYVRGASCDSPEIVNACNDDVLPLMPLRKWSQVQLEVTAGSDYTVFVDGYQTTEGSYALTIAPGACL